MNKFLAQSFLFLGISTFIISCKDDEPLPEPQPQPAVGIQPGQGVFITQEGGFQAGNATMGYWKYTDTSIIGDLFQPSNQRPLGDICQSMTVIGNKGYVVVNNSGKVEVVTLSDFKSVATITGLTSPRYFLPVSTNKAYVTDLFSGQISVVDLNSNTISSSINLPGFTEGLIVANNEVFVCNVSRDQVYVINPQNDLIIDSITVAFGAGSLIQDKNGKLWVLCAGDVSNGQTGGLYRIDPATHQVEQSWTTAASYGIKGLTTNPTQDTLYYLNTDVWQMPITATQLPTTAFISGSSNSWYALGVSPAGEIFVGDAVDFVQRGSIYRYSASGTLITNKRCGINPGSFIFY